MVMIAEGVETDEQVRAVGELECDEAQGYSLSTPRARGDVDATLKLERRFVVVPARTARLVL